MQGKAWCKASNASRTLNFPKPVAMLLKTANWEADVKQQCKTAFSWWQPVVILQRQGGAAAGSDVPWCPMRAAGSAKLPCLRPQPCQLWLETFCRRFSLVSIRAWGLRLEARRVRLNHTRRHSRARSDRSHLLTQPAGLALLWLRGTDVVFSSVADSNCCKWLFAETGLKITVIPKWVSFHLC